MTSANLNKAKAAKNDEFYTQLADIETELMHYTSHFTGKVVFCNCDDPDWSGFWQFFYEKFAILGLKKLIATHYHPIEKTYKLEYDGTGTPIKTPLKANGDFRSPECIALLEQADIVVTNPPFSLFRKYIATLMEFDKKFIIIGNVNAIAYGEIRPFFLQNKIWLGAGKITNMDFIVPDYFVTDNAWADEQGRKIVNLSAISWFTNLSHNRREKEKIILYKAYNPKEFPTYDNYDAIEVSKVKEIPDNYDREMGVPVSFLRVHNPQQFELVGFERDLADEKGMRISRFRIDGKEKYARLIIRRL